MKRHFGVRAPLNAKRLDDAGSEERERVREASQVTVTATRGEGSVERVLPIDITDFLISN